MAGTLSDLNINGLTGTSSDLLEQLADRLGGQARAATIFGDPVDRDGVTVIPVAKAMWGFGGGTGRDDEQQTGSGGGGGVSVSPVGYIEIKGGDTVFRPIFKPPVAVFAMLAGLAIGVLLGGTLGRRYAGRPGPPAWSARLGQQLPAWTGTSGPGMTSCGLARLWRARS